jgi:hypothetical protein
MHGTDLRWRAAGFPTLAIAKKAFSEIRNKMIRDGGLSPGDPFPEAFNEFGLWLIEGHPSADEMLRHGLAYFTFHMNGHGARSSHGYSLVDQIGRTFAFSVETALRGRRPSHKHLVLTAMRYAVLKQTQSARSNAIADGRLCPDTGVALTYENTDVDHAGFSFKQLAECFLEHTLAGAPIENIVLSGRDLSDVALRDRWCAYHATYAQLEAVSKEAHNIRTERRRTDEE